MTMDAQPAGQPPSKQIITLLVNGQTHEVLVRPADTLLWALRTQLGLTGAKPGCENGDCGSCTVLINGQPMHSCLMLAVEAVGYQITTVEGLLHSPVTSAFVNHFAIQCGYCTPGFVLTCHALKEQHPDASDEIIEEWLQSNICRCTGYQEIKSAIQSVLANPSETG